MANVMDLGSQAWREHVFSTPAIPLKSEKSRPAVLNLPKLDGEVRRLDGANNVLAGYILSHFKRIGAVLRWKPRPFEWLMPSADRPSVPMFLVELAGDRTLAVIQTKHARYLTESVQASLAEERVVAEKAAMIHLTWTDESPLTPAARDLHYMIRGARQLVDQCAEQLQVLVDFVERARNPTIDDIVEAGLDPSLVRVAVFEGSLHVPMGSRLTGQTIVTVAAQTDARAYLLLSAFRPEAWWESLGV